MRRSPSEIGPAAGQAVKTARKSLQTSRLMPKTARRTEHRRRRQPCSDVPYLFDASSLPNPKLVVRETPKPINGMPESVPPISRTTAPGSARPSRWISRCRASGSWACWNAWPVNGDIPISWSSTTSYVGKIWLLRSAGHGASGVPDAQIRLPRRALPSRNDLFHSKHRVRAAAALTVLNTRSQIPSRRPEHYLRGQQAASTARQREVLPPGLTPSKKGR
jgi:hypothetical protein